MLHLEIQEGAEAMSAKDYVAELRSQAGCTKRLATATAHGGDNSSGIEDDESIDGSEGHVIDVFCGDSWFASVSSALALQKCGYEFAGVVKNCHSGYPRKALEALMQEWPGGSYFVLVSDNLVATGYKYNSKKVVCFLSTKNFESTVPGKPYTSRWVDKESQNLKFRDVLRPKNVSKYFQHCNVIDSHNHVRQGILSLEEHWQSQCPWFRLVTFFVGVNLTDMWKAAKQGLPGNHFLAKASSKRFAEIVGMEMLRNGLTTNNFGGKPLMQKALAFTSVPVSISSASSVASGVSMLTPVSFGPTVDTPTSISLAQSSSSGFVSEFPRQGKSSMVGQEVNGFKVTHHVKDHIIVDTEKENRCHVCTVLS